MSPAVPSATPRRRPGRDAGTRARLLRAGLGVFAERGYRDASLREICRRAAANNAAVNYHFGSKAGLYEEVVREAFLLAARDRPLAPPAGPPRDLAEARERLRATIHLLAEGLHATRSSAHQLVMLRAMVEPTASLDAVFEEVLGPRFRAIEAALAPFLPDASPRALTLHAVSVLGQVVYHRCAGPVVLRRLGAAAYDPSLVDEITEHVVRFTERALGVRP